MQFSIIALALAAAVTAMPSPDVVGLQGPNGTVNAPVGDYSVDTKSLQSRKTSLPNCKGSSYCSNSQGFKNDCAAASALVQPTTYVQGGGKSGTCSGHCGLFVQAVSGGKDANGNTCSAAGGDLATAYQQILGNECQACGSVAAPVGGDCEITVNYVTGC